MNYLIYDLIILVVLILFALWGRHRGLILSVCSLLALLVAIVGGLVVSNLLTPAVTEWVRPTIEEAVTTAVQSAIPDEVEDALESLPADAIPSGEISVELSPDALLEYLEESDIELPEAVDNLLKQLDEEDLSILIESGSPEEVVSNLAEKAAETIVRVVLFLLSFILILILWHVLAKALDLVSRLPGLNAMNKLGGFLFGALRGALFLFLCAWLLRCSQIAGGTLIPGEAVEQTHLLNFFMTVKPLEFLTSI